MSLPVRGAWIEIPAELYKLTLSRGRSPCGERGLKCVDAWAVSETVESLPVRGAWIEIHTGANGDISGASLPVRGAWIEICWCL